MVPENVGPNVFQVCVSLLTGTLAASEFVRVELSLTQGVGTAEREYIAKVVATQSSITLL